MLKAFDTETVEKCKKARYVIDGYVNEKIFSIYFYQPDLKFIYYQNLEISESISRQDFWPFQLLQYNVL